MALTLFVTSNDKMILKNGFPMLNVAAKVVSLVFLGSFVKTLFVMAIGGHLGSHLEYLGLLKYVLLIYLFAILYSCFNLFSTDPVAATGPDIIVAMVTINYII